MHGHMFVNAKEYVEVMCFCVCVYVCVYVCVSMGNGFVNLCVCKCFNVACVSSKSGASSKSVCKCINMTYDTI